MDKKCISSLWNTTWNTNDPDFPECIMHTAFVWTPCAFVFIVSPFDMYFANSTTKSSKIPWQFRNISRIALSLFFVTLSLIDLLLMIVATASGKSTDSYYGTHILTTSIKLLTFIFVIVLTLNHKKHGIISSGLMFSFWLLATLLAIPQFRHDIRSGRFTTHLIYFPMLLVQLIIHCWPDRTNGNDNKPNSKRSSPEQQSGFVGRILFVWFDSLVWTGWKKTLDESDIWDANPKDVSAELVPKFQNHWQNTADAQDGVGNIVTALRLAYGAQFYLAGLLKFCSDLMNFANPQILSLLITFIGNKEAPLWHGIFLASAFLCFNIIIAILNSQFHYECSLVEYRCRTALISAIYRKSLKISGESNRSVGEMCNMISVDVQRIVKLANYLHALWSGPMSIGLCIYFLWQQLGAAALTAVGVIILMVPLIGYVGHKIEFYQVKQMTKKDERLRIIGEILNSIKILKLYTWEPFFQRTIEQVRRSELNLTRKTSNLNSLLFCIWNIIPFLVTLSSFLLYVYIDPVNNHINSNVIFVALSLFNILHMRIMIFPAVITMMMDAAVSVKRVNRFLNSNDLTPSYLLQNNINKNNRWKEKFQENDITIEKASFSWSDESSPATMVLKNINICVKKTELVAVVGPVGCGKSSLIASILGETTKQSGSIHMGDHVRRSIALVAQQSWILNGTIQDNILFGRPLDMQFYRSILYACALEQDLKLLPAGDRTEIGENGINLSGGQKQRIALARAVYSRAQLYLLDDSFSSIDSTAAKHIFHNVLGPKGLLNGSARLLVTNGILFLPLCNNIYVMKQGQISESGHYDKLFQKSGYFSDLIKEIDHSEIKKAATSKRDNILWQSGRKLISEERISSGQKSWHIYFRYLKLIGWQLPTISIVSITMYQILQVVSNIWLTKWVANPEANSPKMRYYFLGIYTAIGMVQAISLCLSSFLITHGCLTAAEKLHSNFLQQLLRLPMAFFETTPLGRILNRFSEDVFILDNVLPNNIRLWLSLFLQTVAVTIVICQSTPIFMTVLLPLAVLYYFIYKFYIATSRQLRRIELRTMSAVYSHFSETINGLWTIRAFRDQCRFIATFENRLDSNQTCFYLAIVAERWLCVRLEFIGGFVIFFASLFAVLARSENISTELVGLSITYALLTTAQLSWLVRYTAQIENNIVANERIEEYSKEQTESNDAYFQTKLWPTKGSIQIKDLTVRYRPGLDATLHDISVRIEGGQRIGIVGRTGSGKSSLSLALFRIIEASGGFIAIDGEHIDHIALRSLRSTLTIIPQDTFLFSGTIRMNIDPYNMYTDDEIWTALEHSRAKRFVQDLPNGLLSAICNGGDRLSNGQRQLVCLARAFVRPHKCKVLILDEFTALVDLETDEQIQRSIRSQFKHCTILTISHRLSTVMDSDKVLVLKDGRVVEFDSPQSLLKDVNSTFYTMAKDAGQL